MQYGKLNCCSRIYCRNGGIYTKNFITELYNKHRNLILYGFFGAAAAGIDYLVYILLVYFNIFAYPEIASITGNLCGFIFTFLTNTLINFKKRDAYLKRFISYALICIAGSAVSTLLIYLLKGFINVYILKICVMMVVCGTQYLLNKFITYKN